MNTSGAPYVIAIACFKREAALRRLIKSIREAEFLEKPLIIFSVDHGGADFHFLDDLSMQGFCVEVVRHKANLGLVGQFHFCGDLTKNYDAVLFLEEDLIISPAIDGYLRATLPIFQSEKRAACLNTTNMPIDEYTGTAILPYDDGGDLYFNQNPYWGKVWLKEGWRQFKDWLSNNRDELPRHVDRLPRNIRDWPETSFKKTFIAFIVATGSYVPTPRRSYSSNMGQPGLHAAEKPQYRAAMCYGEHKYFPLPFASSLSQYDVFDELLPDVVKKMCPVLSDIDFCMDFKGVRDRFPSDLVLSVRNSSRPLMVFELEDGRIDSPSLRLLSNPSELIGRESIRMVLTSVDDLELDRKDLWVWRSRYLKNKTDFNTKRLIAIMILRFLGLIR